MAKFTPGFASIIPYTVQGGTSGTQPTFDGDPMFYGSYVHVGNLISFDTQVDFDNILDFGTGQYYVTLPFPAKFFTQMRGGCLHDDSTGFQYQISGHVNADSDELQLFTTDISGQALRDYPFEQGEPVTLDTADNFHIAGTYVHA